MNGNRASTAAQLTAGLQSIIRSFDELAQLSQNAGHTTCDVRFGVVHTKNQTDYQLLNFFGLICDEPATNAISALDSCELENNKSAKLFRTVLTMDDIRGIITSINQNTLTLPHAHTNHSVIQHSLDLVDPKPRTYIPPDSRESSGIDFLPLPGRGLHLFEIFDLNKSILQKLNANEIERINLLFQKHTDFSPITHSSRVGNFLVVANSEPIRVEFRGDRSGNGIRIMVVPRDPNLNLNDFAITVSTSLFDEIPSSAIIFPIKNSIHLKDFYSKSRIDVRVWQISTQSLVARNVGTLLGELGVHTSTTQIIRTGIIRRSNGKIQKTDPISARIPLNGGQARQKNTWTTQVQSQLRMAEKKALLRQKKLIHLVNGSHWKALDEIISLINSGDTNDPIKIWDPYIGAYYLDFLTYLENRRKIMVLSEFNAPPGTEDEPKGVTRFSKAIEGCISDYKKTLPSSLVQLVERRRNERSQQVFEKKKNAFKRYLDELRALGLEIEFRYKGHGKGFSFHDRFLFVGERCWSLGSSLNHIGDRHSLIIEVPYRELIEAEFDRLWLEVAENKI